MGKLTISMAIFHSFLYVYQRLNLHFPMVFPWFSYGFPIKISILQPLTLRLRLRAQSIGRRLGLRSHLGEHGRRLAAPRQLLG